MNRVLLFCQLRVATREVVWNIDAGLHGDDHARSQDRVSLHCHCVVSVHAKVVANMVRIKTAHRLHREHREEKLNFRIVLTLLFCSLTILGLRQ